MGGCTVERKRRRQGQTLAACQIPSRRRAPRTATGRGHDHQGVLPREGVRTPAKVEDRRGGKARIRRLQINVA